MWRSRQEGQHETKHCTAVNRGSNKIYFSHIKKSPYQFKCMLYLQYFHCLTLLSDSPFPTLCLKLALWQILHSGWTRFNFWMSHSVTLQYSQSDDQTTKHLHSQPEMSMKLSTILVILVEFMDVPSTSFCLTEDGSFWVTAVSIHSN